VQAVEHNVHFKKGDNMATIEKQAVLEIDVRRGVIYVHTDGVTRLRIGGLKIPKSFGCKNMDSIDIMLSGENVLYNVSRKHKLISLEALHARRDV
jgi:hypothetical protein